jgi:SulP family sulfate permease
MAAMLVALPSAIAFGVAIFAPLGGHSAAQGAVAGMLGAAVLGLIAPALGGTRRLITAPCAPAVAVLSAVAIGFMQQGMTPQAALLLLTLIGLLCGALQALFGLIGLGRLIKYMPYPVVSGYLSGVGLIIITSQVPKLLGTPKGTDFWFALASPSLWRWESLVIGGVTIAVTVLAPRLTKAVPAAILGLAAGVLAYFGLAWRDSALLTMAGNPLVVGPVGGAGGGFGDALVGRWTALAGLGLADIRNVAVPAATLAVLLSIDTLKTCVVVDALTRSRHESNRELIGQGVANMASAVMGGVPGAGQMGATLVNISGGGRTRLSGLIEGVLVIGAMLALGALIAWMSIAALAGVLIVVGLRMFDRHSLLLLRRKSTVLDFIVIVLVVVVAETVSLIAASAVGIALAILLFVREQTGGAVVRLKTGGNRMFSKRVRLSDEMAILEKRGENTAIFELQGSLFFGTANQLYTALEPEARSRAYVILDMRRVQTVDITAAHVLEQIEDLLAERQAHLVFSQLPRHVPSGRDMRAFFDEVGLAERRGHTRTFAELDEALEWVEDRLLDEERRRRPEEQPLDLREMDLFAGRKEATLADLEAHVAKRSVKRGERIFSRGDAGDELFLIRRGAVRIVLPLQDGQSHHLATFGRGDFFGEMAFLDRHARSADAVAFSDTDLYVLSRARFDELADEHKRLAIQLLEGVARVLAMRLRYANAELDNA